MAAGLLKPSQRRVECEKRLSERNNNEKELEASLQRQHEARDDESLLNSRDFERPDILAGLIQESERQLEDMRNDSRRTSSHWKDIVRSIGNRRSRNLSGSYSDGEESSRPKGISLFLHINKFSLLL